MSSEPLIGSIHLIGCNFAPTGYAFCNGQLLPIAQNTALFSILGTTYGGNGTTTFALPDLRMRVPTVDTNNVVGLTNNFTSVINTNAKLNVIGPIIVKLDN